MWARHNISEDVTKSDAHRRWLGKTASVSQDHAVETNLDNVEEHSEEMLEAETVCLMSFHEG